MKTPRLVVWICALIMGTWTMAGAQEGTAPAAAPAKPMYVGSKKCKTCHNSEKGGAQFRHWTESKHSKAFEVLSTDKAKEIAKEKGVADPTTAKECLQCHVTGYGEAAELFKPTFVAAEGVQCETCHGPGSNYMKKSVMQEIRDKKMKAEDYGLHMPTKETCDKCHNEKGTGGKAVDWVADSTKIAHSIPAGYVRGAAAEGETEK